MLMKHNRQGFIPWFVRMAVQGECISLFGTGQQRRDMNEVSDVVDAFLLAASSEQCAGQAFNLGHPDPLSLRELVEILVELCPECEYQLVPFPAEKKRIDIGDIYCDYARFRSAVGWEPRVGPREGLQRMVRFYREHGDQYW
jgi:UDP-glucose 4-epimerase